MNTLTLPQGPLAYLDEGQGMTLLAVHGVPGSHRDFSPLARALGRDLRLVRPDLPGFGETPAGVGERLDQRVRVLEGVLDGLGLERVVLVAHSLGAVSALELAARRPERVAGLVLLAPVGLRPHRFYRRAPVRLAGWLSRRRWLLRVLHPLLVRLLERAGFRYAQTPDAVRLSLGLLEQVDFAQAQSWAAAVQAPALVVSCEDDPLIEPPIGEELARALPNARLLRLARGGHVPQREHAEAILAAVRALSAPAPGRPAGPPAGTPSPG